MGLMDIKDILSTHLRSSRESLLWKAERLGEHDLRLPRTPTGTNLVGLVKHCALVEHGYVIGCFGRTSSLKLPDVDFDADPNGDFYATAEETVASLITLYRRVGEVVDAAIAEMDLDTPGHVPWWGERGDTTLGRILVHVLQDVSRHAGHADILREGIDGSAGLSEGNSYLWEPSGGWPAYVERLTALADRAG